uniref:Uncharacterized protein n=1 Tax=Treubia lacunosa TaxID=93845 RepID=G4Y9S0_9MARC|nr:hypothetical protein TrlaMp21 [Treubia lacunosa]AEH99716.1 hypothetical protein TrlaMp21 [Treubia lacunosa]
MRALQRKSVGHAKFGVMRDYQGKSIVVCPALPPKQRGARSLEKDCEKNIFYRRLPYPSVPSGSPRAYETLGKANNKKIKNSFRRPVGRGTVTTKIRRKSAHLSKLARSDARSRRTGNCHVRF